MSTEEYVQIPIREFLTGMRSPADLYIQLPSGRYLLLFKEDSIFEHTRVQSYLDKEISHLWVRRDEYFKISSSSLDFARRTISQPNLETSKKVFLISNAVQAVYRNFEVLGFNLESYEQASLVTDATLAMADEDVDLQNILGSLNDLDDSIVAHSIAVSILAPIIGQAMGWESPATLKKLSLGGLLHDIGKKRLPPELLRKPAHEMNHEEVKAYESHVRHGAEMLKGLNLSNEDLVSIVFQHHERNNGSGYPQNLCSFKIHPMAKVVGLASEFVGLVVPNRDLIKKQYTTYDALKFIQHYMGQPFDKEVFSALETIVLATAKEPKKIPSAA